MSTVFVLKPIIDVLYEEVNQYKKEIERLNKIISDLTERKTSVKHVNVLTKNVKDANEVVELSDDEDDTLANLAEAPPSSSPAQPILLTHVENQNENINIPTMTQEESKVVKLIAGKDKKEYMKEYQRTYRKKQKENLK
jgi:hypothetical protein